MFHIIQNDPEVLPGTIAAHLRDMAVPFAVCRPYCHEPLPPLEKAGGMIVLGGAMCADDDRGYPFFAQVKEFIRDTVALGVPFLGICLGGQLLAAAMGGRVAANRWGELGVGEVELTAAERMTGCLRGCPLFCLFPVASRQFRYAPGRGPAGIFTGLPAPGFPHRAARLGHPVSP